jgi:hypothetical protein
VQYGEQNEHPTFTPFKKREANVALKARTKKSFLENGKGLKTIDFIGF